MSLVPNDPPGWAENCADIADWRAEQLDARFPWSDDPPSDLDPDDQAPWEITDDDAANWALRKVSRAQHEIKRLRDAANHEIEHIRDWLDQATGTQATTIRFFESKLIDYRRRLEDENADLAKTYKLPGGELCRRSGRTRTTVTDEIAYISWAVDNFPDAVAYRPLTTPLTRDDRFTVTETGALLDTTTGEIVPGVVVSRGDETYSVRVT